MNVQNDIQNGFEPKINTIIVLEPIRENLSQNTKLLKMQTCC